MASRMNQWATVTFCASIVAIGLLWQSVRAEVGQAMKDIEAVQIQEMMKQQAKEKLKGMKRRGQRIYANETTPDESNQHPYRREGIVNQVLKSYSKYREMIYLRAGTFIMGTNDPQSNSGEYPLRTVTVEPFYMDANPVINADFWAFRKARREFWTDAEKKGWSWVVDLFLSQETRQHYSMPGPQGWAAVKKAHWHTPEGPDSTLENRWNHPVVHVSWNDANTFCKYHGKRLPMEHEWEYAAKIGVTTHAYPWGDNWERRRANVWQGPWPSENRKIDGYSITSPVDAYKPQNIAGFYDLIGNVWEWTSTPYDVINVQPHLQSRMVILKGGSYIDSVSGAINAQVRNGQRMAQKQDYSAANVGFRCVLKEQTLHRSETRTTTAPTKEPMKRRRIMRRRRRDEL